MYPLLTLAQEVCNKKILKSEDLHFIIADNNADFRYFESNDLYKTFSYSEYSVAKLRRYFDWQNFIDFFIFIKNIFSSFFFLIFNRPEKIFSKGGFVSLPFGISSFFLRIPFYLHETDSAMGLSNRVLSKFAKKVFTGFPVQNIEKVEKEKYFFVGNPVRPEFFKTINTKSDINNKNLNILIFGGSQGAQALNQWARDFFDISKNKILLNQIKNTSNLNIIEKINVLIVSGKNKSDTNKILNINKNNNNNLYLKNNYLNVKEVEFLTTSFVDEIHKADIVITRAGGSVAELAAAKKCAVLVPLPTSANNHQVKNAEYFAKNNAVLYIKEKDLFESKTSILLIELFYSKEKQKNLSKKLEKFAKKNVVQDIIKYLKI